MKAIFILLFWLNAFLLSAQSSEGFMIFQSYGEVTLQHEDGIFSKPDGMQFLPGDILTIAKGWVSVLDNQMKRVTLKETCTISFDILTDLFRRATASMENKYLVYLWEKMNEEEKHATKKGGVVRGEFSPDFPCDSAVILAGSWCFGFNNPEKQPVQVLIKDRLKFVLQSMATTDSSLCIDSIPASWNQPGKYFWTIRNDILVDSEEWLFFIPTEKEREQINSEIGELKDRLKDIPEPAFSSILSEIMLINKWVY
jgi:hypothetical protein